MIVESHHCSVQQKYYIAIGGTVTYRLFTFLLDILECVHFCANRIEYLVRQVYSLNL